jgi:hypothetical protein
MAEFTADDLAERSQWSFFWVPPDAVVVDRPELLYVYCPRPVAYLNTVTRTRAEPSRLPYLIDEVCAAHAHTRSRWLVRHQPEYAALERAISSAGYKPAWEHRACTVDPRTHRARSISGITARPVSDRKTLLDAFRVSDLAFGQKSPTNESEIRKYLAECTGGRVRRFVGYDDASGQPVSTGGMTLFEELSFGYLWGGGTIPEARSRGAYSCVVNARVAAARTAGIRCVGLYARVKSSMPIVEKQGFTIHGAMTYWDRPSQ